MRKLSNYASLFICVSVIGLASTLSANAQTPPKQKIVAPLKATAAISKHAEINNTGGQMILTAPAWLYATSSPWYMGKFAAGATRPFPTFLQAFSTSTEMKAHNSWSQTSLDKFAYLHMNAFAHLRKSLDILKKARVRASDKISYFRQKGYDMSNAEKALDAADGKMIQAEKAVNAVAEFVPPAIAASTDKVIDKKSFVTLNAPRQLGQTAIDALRGARTALDKAIVEMAHSVGLMINSQ